VYAAGALDIVVGTHALLSTKIVFSNLGLVVVDEEQRFGVNQKEKLKALAVDVDVLTLSGIFFIFLLRLLRSGIRLSLGALRRMLTDADGC
jgi:transcription-repair coupling factor (superfamily II helicase)